jgi:hypothetical protein
MVCTPFGQGGALDQMRGVLGGFDFMDLVADDLAAVEVEDQVQIEPAPGDRGRQPGHVPAPDFARAVRDMRRRSARSAGRLGTAAVLDLAFGLEHAMKARFAGQVAALVGQHRHDPRRRRFREARLVGHGHDLHALVLAERVRRRRALGLRTAITVLQAVGRLPALQRAHVDADDFAGARKPRTRRLCFFNPQGHFATLFHADHASASLL